MKCIQACENKLEHLYAPFMNILYYMCYMKHFKILLARLRGLAIVIRLVKFEIILRKYTGISRYLVQVYISQRSQKYLNRQLFITLIISNIIIHNFKWNHIYTYYLHSSIQCSITWYFYNTVLTQHGTN